MRGLQAVEADRKACQAVRDELLHVLPIERPAVGDKPPVEVVRAEPIEDAIEVRATEGLAAGHGEDELPGVEMLGEVPEEAEPLLGRELLALAVPGAVTAAMEAGEVAALGDFDEEVAQDVAGGLERLVDGVHEPPEGLP